MNARTVTLLATAAALVIAAAAPSWAGKPHSRSGFMIGFGFGGGAARWDWRDPGTYGSSPEEWSGVFNVRIGGAVSENVVLAAEVQSWGKDWTLVTGDGTAIGGATIRLTTLNFAATYWPGNVGAYIRGGVGVASAQAELRLGVLKLEPEPDGGLSLLLAAGYEWRLTEKFAFGPQVELVWLGLDGAVFSDASTVDLGIQFDWYW